MSDWSYLREFIFCRAIKRVTNNWRFVQIFNYFMIFLIIPINLHYIYEIYLWNYLGLYLLYLTKLIPMFIHFCNKKIIWIQYFFYENKRNNNFHDLIDVICFSHYEHSVHKIKSIIFQAINPFNNLIQHAAASYVGVYNE